MAREAEQLENTFYGPPPLLPPMAMPSAPSQRRKGTTRPRRSMIADKKLLLAAANHAVVLATSSAPHGKLCAELRTAPDPAWVMGHSKQRIAQFRADTIRSHLCV